MAPNIRRHAVRGGRHLVAGSCSHDFGIAYRRTRHGVSNLLGSNLFNGLLVALDDALYLKGPILAHVSPLHGLSALSAIIGLKFRPRERLLPRGSLFTQRLLSNRPLAVALIFTFALQLTIIYVPWLNLIFKAGPLTLAELTFCLAMLSVSRSRNRWPGVAGFIELNLRRRPHPDLVCAPPASRQHYMASATRG